MGYYALAMSAVAHGRQGGAAAPRLTRGMPDPVSVVLLARLAVSRDLQGSGIGGMLLVDAMRRAVRGGREFGARAIIVDALDDGAAAFYAHFGFLPLEGRRLWRRLSTVERAIRPET